MTYFSNKLSSWWSKLMFLSSYVACLLSPVVIGIQQKIVWGSFVSVILLLCDVLFLLETCYALKCTPFLKLNSDSEPKIFWILRLVASNKYLLKLCSCSCLLTLTIGCLLDWNGENLAWMSIFRMVSYMRRRFVSFL